MSKFPVTVSRAPLAGLVHAARALTAMTNAAIIPGAFRMPFRRTPAGFGFGRIVRGSGCRATGAIAGYRRPRKLTSAGAGRALARGRLAVVLATLGHVQANGVPFLSQLRS